MQGVYKAVYKDDQHLQHHGIKGMHWGVRRYQKHNGSLMSNSVKGLKYGQYPKKMKKQIKTKNTSQEFSKHKKMAIIGGVAAATIAISAIGGMSIKHLNKNIDMRVLKALDDRRRQQAILGWLYTSGM